MFLKSIGRSAEKCYNDSEYIHTGGRSLKHRHIPGGGPRFETLKALSCLLFFGGTALLLGAAALVGGEPVPAAALIGFSAISLLDAAVVFRAGRLRRGGAAVFAAAVLLCAACLLHAGGADPLWLLLLPVCVPPLLGLRAGLAPVLLLWGMLLPGASSPVLPLFYGIFFLAGILLERLAAYHSIYHAQETAALETRSRTDALTGLCNRWWYNEQLKDRSGQPEYRRRYALFLLDVDNFKNINDTHGHLCGDQVLRRIAGIMEETFRSDGLVCRWGGDEFLCQVRSSSPEYTADLAESIRSAIETEPFFAPSGEALRVTVSIGAVFVPNPQDIYSTELFSMADQALYEAKKNGRNRVCLRVTQTPPVSVSPSGT